MGSPEVVTLGEAGRERKEGALGPADRVTSSQTLKGAGLLRGS